jgi:hypothetical protein
MLQNIIAEQIERHKLESGVDHGRTAQDARGKTVTYSFCESIWAGPTSSWHIRELPGARRLGGGIDTVSLCGRVKTGWDLEVPLTKFHLEKNTCKDCLKEYQKAIGGQP